MLHIHKLMQNMMPSNIIFYDDFIWDELLPLTFTRPLCEMRIGILTIKEKWQKYAAIEKCGFITKDYLSGKYQLYKEDWNYVIHGSLLPNEISLQTLLELKPGDIILDNGHFAMALLSQTDIEKLQSQSLIFKNPINKENFFKKVSHVWEIFSWNGEEIINDFQLITKNRQSHSISSTNTIIGNGGLFVEPGAKAECAIFNTSSGPIYLGADSEVMEGSVVRGPFVLGEHSQLKMSAKIYGPTTIGPHCKVGGEVNNSVIFGYSNKAHDGFLGNAVLGEWVNLGADSNNSNLKNNYAPVKLWNYPKHHFVNTKLTFAGLIMGDYTKCGINTMFNTGTVAGVSCNLYGAGFHRNYIPNFTWGGPAGFTDYEVEKAIQVAEIVMKRRDINMSDDDKDILRYLYTHPYPFENLE